MKSLKKTIAFVAALVIALAAASLVAHFASRFNPYRSDEVHYTAGLEAVPLVLVAVKTVNFVTLGYLERADQRAYLLLTGRLGNDEDKVASVVDIILSMLVLGCVVVFARRVSRRVASHA